MFSATVQNITFFFFFFQSNITVNKSARLKKKKSFTKVIWSNYFLYKMLVLNISRDLGSSAGLFENKSMKAELLILNTRVRLLIAGDTVLCYVRTLSADQPIRCYTLMLC